MERNQNMAIEPEKPVTEHIEDPLQALEPGKEIFVEEISLILQALSSSYFARRAQKSLRYVVLDENLIDL